MATALASGLTFAWIEAITRCSDQQNDIDERAKYLSLPPISKYMVYICSINGAL